ncbi:MAG: addiction module toxin, HicA family [Methanosarcinales archaeon]|uniref:Addiction module toxin, HicA family n=1 Tax=Candidatus Ethanoperedens thermophilum TaxID=2766897 RepID=A0A848D513_9EURY|nr:addiction module toxin, HicA family [Candidatus Ethanoperedens thermophilum]
MKIKPTNWQTQVKIFEKTDCFFVRQRGDHLIFHHKNAKRAVVIPKYDEIPVTVIRNNMKTVGMTREEYFSTLGDV